MSADEPDHLTGEIGPMMAVKSVLKTVIGLLVSFGVVSVATSLM